MYYGLCHSFDCSTITLRVGICQSRMLKPAWLHQGHTSVDPPFEDNAAEYLAGDREKHNVAQIPRS